MNIFGNRDEEEELRLLRENLGILRHENHILKVELGLHQQELCLLREINRKLNSRLSYIKIAIGGTMPVGPAKLTVGDKATATVLGFDQFGAPIAIDFNANPVAWTDDNETAVQDAPSTTADPLTALAPGTANLTAKCAGLTDTETITVVAAPPVLTTIKISVD